MASTQPCGRISASRWHYLSRYLVANVTSSLLFRETVALDQPAHFFLVDHFTDPNIYPKPLSTLPSEAIHQAATNAAHANDVFREPDSLPVFQLALALHSATVTNYACEAQSSTIHSLFPQRKLPSRHFPSIKLLPGRLFPDALTEPAAHYTTEVVRRA